MTNHSILSIASVRNFLKLLLIIESGWFWRNC